MSSVIGLEQSCIKRDLHVQSAVPGRVRYDVRRILWRQPSLAEEVQRSLGLQPGISATANPLTGRILVYYDSCLSEPDVEHLVLEVLASLTAHADDVSSIRNGTSKNSNGQSAKHSHHSLDHRDEHAHEDGHVGQQGRLRK